MADEITAIVEKGQILGYVSSNMNSMFLAPIPKVSDPMKFTDYTPIALCNLIYKISSKIIANRIKGYLSKNIAQEQYGFLQGRSIHDAIAITQEALHSMHAGKKDGIIMKIDLHRHMIGQIGHISVCFC